MRALRYSDVNSRRALNELKVNVKVNFIPLDRIFFYNFWLRKIIFHDNSNHSFREYFYVYCYFWSWSVRLKHFSVSQIHAFFFLETPTAEYRPNENSHVSTLCTLSAPMYSLGRERGVNDQLKYITKKSF